MASFSVRQVNDALDFGGNPAVNLDLSRLAIYTQPQNVAGLSALRALVGSSSSGAYQSVNLLYGSAPGDGVSGVFYWTTNTTLPDDGVNVIVPGVTPRTGAWVRAGDNSVSILNFGGPSNARYRSSSNGKWYQDAALTTEADDDAIKFQRAANYISALGGGEIYIPAGNWYFKTKRGAPKSHSAGADAGNEFVRTGPNTRWIGTGAASAIRIAPGCNTAAFGGYSTAIGYFDVVPSPTAVDNVEFCDFLVDHNGEFNQNDAALGTKTYAQYTNNAVRVSAGRGLKASGIHSYAFSGVYAITLGEYGTTTEAFDITIENCRVYDLVYDFRVLDASYITCGAIGVTVTGNQVSGTVLAGTTPFTPQTCYELHGSKMVITGNFGYDCNGALNIAADSGDMYDVVVSGNVFVNCTAGINVFQFNGWDAKNVHILGNVVTDCIWGVNLIQENPGFGGANKVYNLRIADNQFVCRSGSSSYPGVYIRCQAGGGSYGEKGIEIRDNHVIGFNKGIQAGPSQAAGVINGLQIIDNIIEDTDVYGIEVTSLTGAASANILNARIDGNVTVDTRGGSATMTHGLYVDAWLDGATCVIGQHSSYGHATAAITVSTGVYGSSSITPPTLYARTILGGPSGFDTGVTTGGVLLRDGAATLADFAASSPSAPSDGARLYCDTSGGKHRLLVRFPSGASQLIATEP